jgi:hypothetical protein
MDVDFCTSQLQDNARRISELVSGMTIEEARWKPDSSSWSILEVINHLYDEEREDFRVRLDVILNDPQKPWPPIDPQGWIKSRNYNERYLDESLQKFLSERDHSLAWLKNLGNPDWYSEYPAPFGTIRAGDIFAAWVTHDHLHMRQLVELQRALTLTKVSPFILDYAGDW